MKVVNPVKCVLCSYTAPNPSTMKKHKIQVHTDLRPCPCTHPGCDFKGAKTLSNLNKHLKLHQLDPVLRKPFHCTVEGCDFRAPYKSVLNYHVKIRHTNTRTRDFPSVLCPSKCFTQAELNVHIESSHLKENVYECKYCNFKTHFKHVLSRHLKRRNLDPLLRCSVLCVLPGCRNPGRIPSGAEQKFCRRHNPNRERNFRCPFCPQTLFTPQGVNMHLKRVHLNENDFECNKCSYKTISWPSLELYLQK